MGLTHLDAGVIIAFLDADDTHHDAATSALANALGQADRLSIAASALAECLVGPARRSTTAVELVRTAIGRLPVSVVPLDEDIATRAAGLRARHRTLKLPDALVIATAETSRADRIITTDRRWPTARAMKLALAIEEI
ncbi:MAG: PIN domain-containing protein [Ilumatobacteraceae bacterium]|nr:PIN domain-containing protein [Ilumatobacteraceae bacterium]